MKLIKRLPIAALTLAAFSWPSLAAEDLSKSDIEQIVRDYISNNPEVIVESLQKWQEEQQAAADARQKQALKLLPAAFEDRPLVHIAGNPEGSTTLYEFFDYNCGFCKKALPDVLKLIEQDNDLRIVMIEFPILHESSYLAAQAAIAAQMQDSYMAFHTNLMTAKGQMSEGRLLEIATQSGLDAGRLAKDMRDPKVTAELDQNYQIAKVLGVNSTPHFIVGTQVAPGAVGFDELKSMIKKARAE